jgi:hypothetical protein
MFVMTTTTTSVSVFVSRTMSRQRCHHQSKIAFVEAGGRTLIHSAYIKRHTKLNDIMYARVCVFIFVAGV